MTKLHNLKGLILNGGSSSRMGSPKGEIKYHNKSQHQYLYELLTPLCDAVYFSVKHSNQGFKYPQIEDQLALESPMNGIFSALKFSTSSGWLVVAIDMPLLNEQVLHSLISHRDLTKVATCYYDSSGERPEPLVSIWEPISLNHLENFIQDGGMSPRSFLEKNSVKLISTNNPDVLININSKEELAMFQKKNQKS